MGYLHSQQWRRHTWASGVKTSHKPNVKYTAQEPGGDLCDYFQVFIAFVLKIGKE